MTTEELLGELQTRCPEGIVALTFPDSMERLYLWWGDRTLDIGLAGRLSHSINRELEEWEDEDSCTGALCHSEVGPPPEGHCGTYL